MVILGWVLAIAVAVVVIAIAVMFLNRFYRKSTREIARCAPVSAASAF